MSKVSLTINGQTVTTESENTILQAARQEGIFIATLCHNPLLKPEEACRICVVEVKGEPKPVASCSFKVAEGMEVQTDTATIREYRKNILSLLLEQHYGDCVAPCHMTCPGKLDIQGYVAHIARGNYIESLRLIKEKTPFAAALGRVCPHPCESECRRTRVEEAINIKDLKRYVADYAAERGIRVTPKPPADTGKKVAIIGGGPAGLAAAYYLRLKGHAATIYDAMPKLGGMLRYGIPEYRLPKAVLDEEIAEIIDLGVEVITNKKFGKDFTLASLKSQGYDAIFMAIGAWNSYKLGIPGEDLPGVMSAIEFLIRTASGDPPPVGKKVIVVGNGNTGMDAARSCLRMGAKEVIMLYRRTKAEMPANPQEIHDAEQEGIKIHILATPTRIVSKDGRFSGVEYLKNELKAADSSGRPSPVPIKDSETIIEADQAIISIGQFSDMTFLKDDTELKGVAFTKKGIPETDSNTLQSCLPYLFIGGDLLRGPRTVIQASADGREAALSIHSYLTDGVVIQDAKPFNITRGKLNEVDPVNFEGIVSYRRNATPILSVSQRVKSFEEAELVLTEAQAKDEASRCLSCGCQDAFECRLREYATIYEVDQDNLQSWKKRKYDIIDKHPLITIDPNKCITCRKCVHGCSEYQVQYAFDLIKDENSTGFELPVYTPKINDRCVSCGYCLANCPTGALSVKSDGAPGPWKLEKVRTTCTYCGVGCQLYLEKVGDRVVRVNGVENAPPNYGHLCVKGRFGFNFIYSDERLKVPLIRKGDKFRQATWDEAFELVVSKLKETIAKHGPDAVGGVSCARSINEDSYQMQKLFRAVIGTNNIDHCARVCHAPTVVGLAAAFGSSAMTNSLSDFAKAKMMLVIGSNMTEAHPVAASAVKRAVLNGAELYVVDPRQTDLAKLAKVHLPLKVGSDIALINGLMNVLITEDLYDKNYVSSCCVGFEELKQKVMEYTPERAAQICGLDPEMIRKTARRIASVKPAMLIYTLGITEHTCGVNNVLSCANLQMLLGNVGFECGGVNPLRGQNNVQGACDMGALPNVFPGYQKVESPEMRAKFEAAWKTKLPAKNGMMIPRMFDGLVDGKIKFFYVFGENLASTEPDIHHVEHCLESAEFLVCQDNFQTETTRFAHVILPAASWSEDDGTFANCERRVSRVRTVKKPPGVAKPNWWIFKEIARRMGHEWSSNSAQELWDNEISVLAPQLAGIKYSRIEGDGLQWPVPALDHSGTPILHKDGCFTCGLGNLTPVDWTPPAEVPDVQYPFVLSTGRRLYHYHTRTQTGRTKGLNDLLGEETADLSYADAERLGIKNGEMVRVKSRRGEVVVKAKVTDQVPAGMVWMAFHFRETNANWLTNAVYDPVSLTAEYKACAVSVEKI